MLAATMDAVPPPCATPSPPPPAWSEMQRTASADEDEPDVRGPLEIESGNEKIRPEDERADRKMVVDEEVGGSEDQERGSSRAEVPQEDDDAADDDGDETLGGFDD